VVFFAIGFETTAPANAMAVHLAKQEGLTNFSVLVSHVLVPPAIARSRSPTSRVDGFLAAGHVCSVMGTWQYGPLVEQLRPADRGHRLRAARRARRHPPHGRAARGRGGPLENAYARVVTDEGNVAAQACWRRCSR
jgi:hydrogenase expression/formation protein HypD